MLLMGARRPVPQRGPGMDKSSVLLGGFSCAADGRSKRELSKDKEVNS